MNKLCLSVLTAMLISTSVSGDDPKAGEEASDKYCAICVAYQDGIDILYYAEGSNNATPCHPNDQGYFWGDDKIECPDDCTDGCSSTPLHLVADVGEKKPKADAATRSHLKNLYKSGTILSHIPKSHPLPKDPSGTWYPRRGVTSAKEQNFALTIDKQGPIYVSLFEIVMNGRLAENPNEDRKRTLHFGIEHETPQTPEEKENFLPLKLDRSAIQSEYFVVLDLEHETYFVATKTLINGD